MLFNSGDLVQLVYKDVFNHSIQVIESKFLSNDKISFTLESGTYKIKFIKGIRNLTQEAELDEESL